MGFSLLEDGLTFLFGKLVWAVLQPGNLLMLCLLAGVLLFLVSRGRRGKVLVGISLLGFLVLAVAPIGPAMMLALEERFPRPQLPERIDGILVLGGAVDPALSLSYGETVFNSAVARVLAGIALARRYPEAKRAVIGGGGGCGSVWVGQARGPPGFFARGGSAPPRAFPWGRSRSTPRNRA